MVKYHKVLSSLQLQHQLFPLLKDNNLKRNETLFIDDSPQHVEGAKKAGLNAQWLDLKKEDIILLINRLSLI